MSWFAVGALLAGGALLAAIAAREARRSVGSGAGRRLAVPRVRAVACSAGDEYRSADHGHVRLLDLDAAESDSRGDLFEMCVHLFHDGPGGVLLHTDGVALDAEPASRIAVRFRLDSSLIVLRPP